MPPGLRRRKLTLLPPAETARRSVARRGARHVHDHHVHRARKVKSGVVDRIPRTNDDDPSPDPDLPPRLTPTRPGLERRRSDSPAVAWPFTRAVNAPLVVCRVRAK